MMQSVNTNEMISFIKSFVGEMNDYDPLSLDHVTGCYNTKYHGNLCQAVINPPITKNRDKSYPRIIIAYILIGDDIILCDSSLDAYNLIDCLGDSISNVYENIKLAYSYKTEFERNQKEDL